MKLRTKTWAVVLITISAMLGLLGLFGGRAFLSGFEQLEHLAALRDASRVLTAIDGQRDEIERTARDYGEWIDTIEYAAGRAPTYEDENWGASSLENIKVNSMLVFDITGRFAGGVEAEADTDEVKPASRPLVSAFAQHVAAAIGDPSKQTRIKGITLVEAQPWVFACVPMFDPNEAGEPQGAIVVARKLDEAFVAGLCRATQLPLTLSPTIPDEAGSPQDLRFEPSANSSIAFATAAPDEIVGHLTVLDIAGRPAAALRLSLDRPIHRQAVRTAWLILAEAMAIALLCGLVFHALLSRAVVSRLEGLHSAVSHVGQQNDLSVRVAVKGNDEIAGLGRALNTMLDGLSRGREERERAQREREVLQDQLVLAQKMEAIGDFAGGIAHDFNNCLTTITGWLSLVREDLPRDNEHRESLDLALASASHASAVVKQLLVYSRQSESVLTHVSMREILGSSLQLLRAALPRSIQLHLSESGDDDSVLADSTQIKQVVLNLVKNAADAINPPGSITLTLAAVALPSTEAPGAEGLPAGRYAHLSVKDSGSGIAPANLERIFEPFFTTKPTGKGTGLGLAVVRSVVVRHRGAIGVTSPTGEGATFHVYLPLHVAAPASTRRDLAVRPPAGCPVLVVDDDPAVRRVICRLTANLGYSPESAADGLEAWEMFRMATRPFEIVLTDLTMPKLNGMQLGERIFNSQRRSAVILMSAYASTLDPDQLRRAGFSEVLPKPIDTGGLRLALARARQPEIVPTA